MFSSIITFVIIMLVIVILLKLGVLQLTTKKNYVFKRKGKELSFRYQKFDGFEYHYFWFGKGAEVTLTYEVTVEEGELALEWISGGKIIWQQSFTSNSEGSFTTQLTRRYHSVRVVGRQTKGECRIRFT
ncbi:hypothetical protein ABDI30_02920 [Paenibacillus cisolokensis]|uniref:hypothetical protein n=1 Tax=Paenibacillus cisolokensis TaxID=1658519 RepID=UPI003D2D503C